MASYHCSVKVGGKGKAAAHAQYIAREGKYSGYEQYEDLEATGRGNMPAWAEHNPAHFWAAADQFERANGATYREIEVALPRELTPDQRRDLVEDFIQQELGDRHAYQWAIHCPAAAIEGGEQPHAHIMYSERTIDGIDRDPEQYFKRYNAKAPERGGCRKDSAGTPERLQATRERWATIQNAHLERHGHAERVDHRSLADQGIQRTAEKHVGWRAMGTMQPGDVAALLERRAAERELEEAQRGTAGIDIAGDLAEAMRERPLAEQREHAERALEQRRAEIDDLAKRRTELMSVYHRASPRELVEEAHKRAPGLAKKAAAAERRAEAMETELEGLSPLRFIKRRRLEKELPEAQAQAQELRKKADDAKTMASKPIKEKVQAALDELEQQIKPGEERYRDAQMELHRVQAQEAAQKAQEAALQRQARAEAEREQARRMAAEIEANLGKWRDTQPQQQRERAQDRDDGPTLGR